MIRKLGKARWQYECEPCGYVYTAVDMFGVTCAEHDHLRTFQHVSYTMSRIGEVVADVYETVASTVLGAWDTLRSGLVAAGYPVTGTQWQDLRDPHTRIAITGVFPNEIVEFTFLSGPHKGRDGLTSVDAFTGDNPHYTKVQTPHARQ